MAKYRCGGGGSPDIVNGVIEEYLAESEDISANTFVDFVGKGSGTDGSSIYGLSACDSASAVILDDTHVLIAFGYDTTSNYVTICTIGTDDNIRPGTWINIYDADKTVISNVTYLHQIDSTHVLLLYNCCTSLHTYKYRVLTIKNYAITVGDRSDLIDSNPCYTYYINSNKFLMYGAACYVATINADYNISITASVLPTTSDSLSLKMIDLNTYIMVSAKYRSSSNYSLDFLFLNINEDNTITFSTITSVTSLTVYDKKISVAILDNNRIVVLYKAHSNTYISAAVFSIENQIINLLMNIKTEMSIISNIQNSAETQEDNSVILNSGPITYNMIFGDYCCIYNSKSFTKSNEFSIYTNPNLRLNDGRILFMYTTYSSGYTLRLAIRDFSNFITKAGNASQHIPAITKTKASTTEKGKVAIVSK